MASASDPDDGQLVDSDEVGIGSRQQHGKLEINTGNQFTGLEYVNPALDDSDDPPARNAEPRVTIVTQSDNPVTSTENGQTSFPVHFESETRSSNKTHNNSVRSDTVAKPELTSTSGMAVIQTRQLQNQEWNDMRYQRPLRKKHILLLKVFSIIALVLFFPTGMVAVYFAFKVEPAFEEGIMQGNIDKAQKYARRTEHLIIFSGLFALLTAVIVFALVERSLVDSNDTGARNRIMAP